MKYKLDLGQWEFIFAVPCSIVDKYINDANEIQIKVLLWILKNREIDFNKISVDLKLDILAVQEAFEFWKKLGIFSIKDEFNSYKSENSNEEIQTKKFPNTRYKRPNFSYIVSRIKESNEIGLLMREAQIIFSRPISSAEETVLIMLHDNEGLPVDVILMLIQYAVSVGKGNIRYIEKMGMNWSNSGIDSIEKAENKINSLNLKSIIWKKYENLIGIEKRTPTQTEEELVIKWYKQWKLNDDLIKYAYDICIDTKGKYNIKYIDGILKRWQAKGILTKNQAKENKNTYKSEKNRVSRSYDIDEIKRFSIFDDE